MEPMKGKWASSRVDLGYTELFCIPDVHQCSSRFVTVSGGLSGVPSRKSRLLTCLIGNTGLLCMQCRGIEPHFPARGMSHTISRVATGTWGIFASYSGDGHSKLHLVQRSQDSCLVTMDTSGMQNCSVYHNSTRDEAHFHFIGSIAIPCSTAYSTSG